MALYESAVVIQEKIVVISDSMSQLLQKYVKPVFRMNICVLIMLNHLIEKRLIFTDMILINSLLIKQFNFIITCSLWQIYLLRIRV
jgi:hypothetical protein